MHESRKKDIRKMILSQRNKISLKERQKKSALILEQLIKTSHFLKAFTMMIYVSFSSEVMTEKLINYALRKGKRIASPWFTGKAGKKIKINTRLNAHITQDIDYLF